MTLPTATPHCSGGFRHWFTRYGWVGSSAPTCLHCGAPNPHYDPERDPEALAAAKPPDDTLDGHIANIQIGSR